MADLSDPDLSAFLSGGTRTGAIAWTATGRAPARDPRAVLCVDLEEPPYAFVEVQGSTTLSEDPDELRRTATAPGARSLRADRAGARYGVPGEFAVRLHPPRVVAAPDTTA